MRFLTALSLLFVLHQGGQIQTNIPEKYRRKPPTPTTVVARVNGIDITAGDVEAYLWDWWGADATQDFITYQTVKSEAEKQRIDASDAEVDAAIAAFYSDRHKADPSADLDAMLRSQGMTKSRLYLRFKPQLLVKKILERDFKPAELVKVSTIIFRPASAQTTALTEAINRADAAYKRLSQGTDWSTVFKENSPPKGAEGSNGLIGWRSLTAFEKSVSDELQKLKPGQFTKPATTVNGIQIFRLEVAGKDAKGADLDQMKQAYTEAGFGLFRDRLHREAKIEKLWPPDAGQ